MFSLYHTPNPTLPRLLFLDLPDNGQREAAVEELLQLSGVEGTLRAQALTLEQFQDITTAYTQLVSKETEQLGNVSLS